MKREKDEKIMGPMFPRLHVNDTDKGGPRAPPRNKMALYEQLTIPSDRFNGGASSFDHPSIQAVTKESAMLSTYNLPTRPRLEKQIKNLEDDDFSVPIFLRPVLNTQECRQYTSFNHQSKFQKNEKSGNSIKQESNSRREENVEKFASDWVKPVSNSSTVEKAEYKNGSERCNTSVLDENLPELEQRNDSTLVKVFSSEDQNSLHDSSNKTEPQLVKNSERVDSLSENSVVGSISGRDITPDDVVEIIGQKHFWKARREILNQQRIFAIQVFELHRVIKVQKLIAASPHILLENSAYTKPINASPEKRKPLHNSVNETPYIPKQKGEPEEPIIHKNKISAENATEEKASSLTSVKTGIPPAKFRPATAESPARAVSSDFNFGPWGFSPPPPLGNQWLIPVISPSEGLVYKPYPAPGFVGPECGGFGPLESNPSMGNFPYPSFGVPSPHPRYQFSASPWAGSHGYFAPYGMPRMNNGVFSGSSAKPINGSPFTNQIVAQDLNLSANPDRKNRAASQDVPGNLNVSEDIEVQASIGSSHVDRDNGQIKFIKERNVLPLFPTAPSIDGPIPDRPVQVIKVVPHNGRSARASAARIFQAIQEGRKQYDSA